MKKLKDFYNFLKNKFALTSKFTRGGFLGDVNFHWKAILVCAVAGVIIISVQSYWMYRSIGWEDVDGEKKLTPTNGGTVTNEMIDAVIERFNKRKKLFDKVQTGYFYTVDPAR